MNDAVSAARRKANAIKWVTIRVSTEGTIVTMQISDDGRIAGLRPVCTKNLVRIDLATESRNVGRDGRAAVLPY